MSGLSGKGHTISFNGDAISCACCNGGIGRGSTSILIPNSPNSLLIENSVPLRKNVQHNSGSALI
jgi:hypothetical protein